MLSKSVLFALVTILVPGSAIADCVNLADGTITPIKVKSCQAINGATHPKVLKSGDISKFISSRSRPYWDYKAAYTGALVTDAADLVWMYTSSASNPCKSFTKSKPVRMRTYSTCCDTGSWGKCVLGGKWLGDVKGKRIDAFQ